MAARKGKQKGEKKLKKGVSKGAATLFKKRSAASRKGWETRRRREREAYRKTKKGRAEFKRHSEASKRGWETRKRKQASRDLHHTRLRILGIGKLHGRDRADWYLLKEAMLSDDPRYLAFLQLAEDLGVDEGEARDEWMSPKVKG